MVTTEINETFSQSGLTLYNEKRLPKNKNRLKKLTNVQFFAILIECRSLCCDCLFPPLAMTIA